MKRLIFVLLIVFIFNSNAKAQSLFLEKGKSGFGLDAGYLSNEDASAFGGGLGYSINGMFDIYLGVSRSSFKEEVSDLKALGFSPNFQLFIIKQTNVMPLSFSIGAGYGRISYSGEILDISGIKMKSTGYFLNARLNKKISANSILKLIPSIGIGYSKFKSTIENSSTYTEDADNTTFDLILNIVFEMPSKDMFIISPLFSVDEDYTTIGISLGFVFQIKA